jgi:hypothetical protein
MVDITLLELHLEDASFEANAPLSRGESGGLTRRLRGGEADSSTESTAEESDGQGKAFLGLLFVLAAAGLAWWLARGERPEVTEDIEVTA